MKKIKKYIEFCTTKIIQFFQERKFTFEGVDLKYLFKSCSTSDTLIVVFSACTRAGIKARYNYVRTLKGINANCLFILDDFGEDRRGAYYLGKNCGDEIEIATKKLISDIYSSCKAKKLLFCGSSKGGWAALNFMTSFPESIAIVGAPQYNLGNYLMAPALVNTRNYVLPEPNEEKITYLNDYLKRKLIVSATNHNTVYLHYSNKEHTYEEHVRFLIDDLTKCGYQLFCDCKEYTEHWDVSKYFPDYLLNCINENIS